MAGTDDDGLDLKLPWGPPQPKAAEARSRRTAGAGQDAGPGSGAGQPPEPAPPEAPIEAAERRMDERLKQVEHDFGRRFDQLEERASQQSVGLEAHLEKVAAAHAASTEATSLLAGHLVTQLREELASLEAVLVARHERSLARVELMLWQRHEELVAKLDVTREVMVEAVAGVASRTVTERLLEGVATIAELVDTELSDLRRVVGEQRRVVGSPPPGDSQLRAEAP